MIGLRRKSQVKWGQGVPSGFILTFFLLLLVGCAARPALIGFPSTGEPEKVSPVFVSTTRGLGEDGTYQDLRSETPSYLRYDISVPQHRSTGGIDKFTRDPDPDTDFLVSSAARYPSAESFRADLRRSFLMLPVADREALIYVHGFNNTFDEGILRISQLSDDFHLDGVALHYSWPSAASPLGYEYDKDSVLFARDGLEDLIRQVRAAGAQRVLLVGHSMGAQLIVETLRQMEIARPGAAHRDIGAVILVSPDIDEEVFRSQLSRIEPLPDPFLIFVSRRDRALQLSAWLTGQQDRLGNIEDLSALQDFKVTIIDVTSFSSGIGHFTPGDSPALISLLSNLGSVDAAFAGDTTAHIGLLPGVALTIQNATGIILSPITAIAE